MVCALLELANSIKSNNIYGYIYIYKLTNFVSRAIDLLFNSKLKCINKIVFYSEWKLFFLYDYHATMKKASNLPVNKFVLNCLIDVSYLIRLGADKL